MYLILAYIERLISRVSYFFSYFGVSINCKLHNIFLTLSLRAFSIVIYESSISTNQYFLAFFCLVCKLFKSDLEIINLILDIFRYVISAYIIRISHTVFYRKINFNCQLFFSYFLLVNVIWMSYYFNYAKYFRHVQKIKHCLCLKPFSVLISGELIIITFYIFNFCLVFKLYKPSLQILQFISGHLRFLDSVDIGCCLIVALIKRWTLTLAHFSDAFLWPVNFTCQVCI